MPVREARGEEDKACEHRLHPMTRSWTEQDRSPRRRPLNRVREVAQLVFFLGTLAPFLRASERPMAMACFRLFTWPPLPLLPERKVPLFLRCIALFTLLPAALPYLAISFLLWGDQAIETAFTRRSGFSLYTVRLSVRIYLLVNHSSSSGKEVVGSQGSAGRYKPIKALDYRISCICPARADC